MTVVLLRCHCCFSTVEAEEPRTGSIFNCDMCHAELEVSSTGKGYTRPPHRPGVASAIHAAIGHEPSPRPPADIPTRSTIIVNPWAHSATLQRKRAAPAEETSSLHLTPPSGIPAVAIDATAETAWEQAKGRNGEDERELEPTTARVPRESAAGAFIAAVAEHRWTALVLLLIALVATLASLLGRNG